MNFNRTCLLVYMYARPWSVRISYWRVHKNTIHLSLLKQLPIALSHVSFVRLSLLDGRRREREVGNKTALIAWPGNKLENYSSSPLISRDR